MTGEPAGRGRGRPGRDAAAGRARDAGRNGVLRPGVLLPVMGRLGALGVLVLAVVGVLHPGAPNHSLGNRWGFGEILAVWGWGLYKLGSQRIVMGDDEMRILTWGVCWRVARGEVRDVALSAEPFSLAVILDGGYRIRPSMFLASPGGVGYLRAGLFKNAMSRVVIRERILAWNAAVPPVAGGGTAGRRWRVRHDLPLLAGVSLVIAVEAVVLTRLGIW